MGTDLMGSGWAGPAPAPFPGLSRGVGVQQWVGGGVPHRQVPFCVQMGRGARRGAVGQRCAGAVLQWWLCNFPELL